MLPVDRLQLILGQAVLPWRTVVNRDRITSDGWMAGRAQVRVEHWRMRGDSALFGEIFHRVDDRLLAAVFQQLVSVGLEIFVFAVEERL
jgi:hypothetical protein